MEAICSNDNLAVEISSWSSALEFSRFKCISKRWKNLISHLSFILVHQQRSRLNGISNLPYQLSLLTSFQSLKVIVLGGTDEIIYKSFPAKCVVMGLCAGLIHCGRRQSRDQELPKIFICNPMTRECISLRSTNWHVGHIFAFAFSPFGSSLNKLGPLF